MNNIDFFFSIGSTYTYLSVTRILEVEKKNQVNNEAYKKYLEGNYLVKINDSLDKSARLLKESIKLDNSFSKPYATLALNRNLMGDFDEAEEYLDDALDIAEDNDDK